MKSIGSTSRRRFIAGAWILAASGCAWAPERSFPSPRGGVPGQARGIMPEELEELRTEIVEAHNRIRTEAKLRKFTPSRRLTAAAQNHAEDMAARKKMTHIGKNGSSSADRVKARGYRYLRAGENVAAGYFTVERVMKGWMDSRGHKKNILGGFSEIGVGCAVDEDGKRYWCVNFGLPSGH